MTSLACTCTLDTVSRSRHTALTATATQDAEQNYPYNYQMTACGMGGVWVLCASDDARRKLRELWYVRVVTGELPVERLCHRFAPGSKLCSDGCGGVWVLATSEDKGSAAGNRNANGAQNLNQNQHVVLWHATKDGGPARSFGTYPASTAMVQDSTTSGKCYTSDDVDDEETEEA